MGVVSRLMRGAIRAHTPDAWDDSWYGLRTGGSSQTGVYVSASTAMKLSAVWRCVSIISGSVAMLPLKVYERRADGGADVAPAHPLYDLMYSAPNRWQTSYEWRRMSQQHLLLRGNAYSQIVSGRRGPVDQLIPLHPDAVTPEQQPDMSIKYRVRFKDKGAPQTLFQDEIFHLIGLTDDGVKGMAVLDHARESIGLGLAQESYGARFFSQSSTPPGVLLAKGRLKPEAANHIRDSWMAATAGSANQHKWPVLEEGFDLKQLSVGLTADQAQLIESREFSVSDIARWFGVPNHMVGETTKETSWGTGIEQMSMGFVRWGLMDWLTMWEHRIGFSLIVNPARFYAKFTVNALERGDLKTRSEALQVLRQNGIITANEWRALEDMNPVDGPEGDALLWPVNFAPADANPPAPVAPATFGAPAAVPDEEDDEVEDMAALLKQPVYVNGASTGYRPE